MLPQDNMYTLLGYTLYVVVILLSKVGDSDFGKIDSWILKLELNGEAVTPEPRSLLQRNNATTSLNYSDDVSNV